MAGFFLDLHRVLESAGASGGLDRDVGGLEWGQCPAYRRCPPRLCALSHNACDPHIVGAPWSAV